MAQKDNEPNEGQLSRPGDGHSAPFSFHCRTCNHVGKQECAPQFYGTTAPQSSPVALYMASPGGPPSNPPLSTTDHGAPKKNHRWNDTEEKIFIELLGENEENLRNKAHNSPEWASLVRQLRERCQWENVACDKSAQQCKNKMANLKKKHKRETDKLRPTGYGRRGDDEQPDKENSAKSSDDVEFVPRYYKNLDEILSIRRHVLESSVPEVESAIDREIAEKEALDEEILCVAERRQSGTIPRLEDVTPRPSDAESSAGYESDEDQQTYSITSDLAQSRKRTSTPKAEKAVAAEKSSGKKARGMGVDDSPVLSFLERAQERHEAFMDRMAEAERRSRREQQKFSLEALAILGNILKYVAKGRE